MHGQKNITILVYLNNNYEVLGLNDECTYVEWNATAYALGGSDV